MRTKITIKCLFYLLLLALPGKALSQCFQIESILVAACIATPGTEGYNEMVRFKVGAAPVNTATLTVNWPAQAWQGLVQNATTAASVAAINADIALAGGCGQLVEPVGGVIPAGAEVVLITSQNFSATANVFGAITQNIYVLFQDNTTVTAGHFGNFNATPGIRTLTMNFGGGCTDTVSYERASLSPNPGATANFTPTGVPSYTNPGCVAPVEVFSVDAGTTPVTACPGETIALSGTAVGATTINGWTAAAGTFSTPASLTTNYTLAASASGSIVLTLSVTNSCGVVKTDTVTVNVNATVTPTFTAVPAICSGATLSALPTTSNNSITGSWSPALDNTATTIYTFTPNAGQCAVSTTLTITVNTPVTPTFTAVPAICAGSAIAALPTTSNNGYTGSWSPAIDNTTTTTYTFTPTAGQCATTATMTIGVNPANTVPAFNAVASICNGDPLAALPTTSTNGISGSWSPAINNTTTTTYTFTPATGQCAVTTTLTITVNPLNIIPSFAGYPSQCSGSTIAPLPTTSINGITGSWSPATINNTATTTYTFTPNLGQCAVTRNLNIVIFPNLTPTFGSLPSAVCSGATLTLPVSSDNLVQGTWSPAFNNTATTTYTFTPNIGQCAVTINKTITINPSTVPVFNPINVCAGLATSPLPATSTNGISGTWSPAYNASVTGTYTFTPNPAGPCATTATLTVNVSPNLTPTFAAVAPICAGATIAALPTTSTNGIVGSWSPAINNTTTTTYTFTPTAGQCAVATTLVISVNAPITPTFNPIPNVCAGSGTSPLPATSANGISGSWSPVFNNTTTTTYTFTPNTGQCATTRTLTVVVSPVVTPTFNPMPTICSGTGTSPLPATSVNGITGSWSPAFSNTTTTTYTFTPTAGQCASTTTLTLTVVPVVTPTFNAVAPICAGSPVAALPTTSTNGIVGSWSPVINNTTTTTYTFTPNNVPGQCRTPATLTITIIPRVTPTFVQVPPICSGAALAALPTTSTNGISGAWTPPLDNTATRTYTFTPSAGVCASTATMIITVNPVVTPTFTQVPPICRGGLLSALPTTSLNGISGSWSPALNNTVTTNYTFTPTAGQCASIKTMQIVVKIPISPVFTGLQTVICGGDAVTPLPTTSTNGVTGTWSPALSNTVSGVYTFTPNAGQCATTALTTITVNDPIIPLFDGNTIPVFICPGAPLASLPTTSMNGITGTWSPAIDNTVTTTYTFTPTPGQCAAPNALTINVFVPDTKTENYYICVDRAGNGTNTSIIDTNLSALQYTFAWTFNGSPITYTGDSYVATEPGVYTVAATNIATGCVIHTIIANVAAVYPATAVATLNNDFADAQQITVTITGGLGGYEYQINGGAYQKSNVFDIFEGGEYTIHVIDNLGCNEFTLTVTALNYPHFFTPNGDGYHDFWNIEGFTAANKAEIYIFDRYGKLLKQISPLSQGWDGTYNGAELPGTDYWFKLLYLDKNKVPKEFNSHFSLKR